jgi:hypothetical protein
MTDWKYNLYLADLHDEFDKGSDADVKMLVQTIYKRLMLMRDIIEKTDDDVDYILGGTSGLDSSINEFEYFDYTMNREDQVEEFDRIMDELADWADYNFVWINLFDVKMKGIGKS